MLYKKFCPFVFSVACTANLSRELLYGIYSNIVHFSGVVIRQSKCLAPVACEAANCHFMKSILPTNSRVKLINCSSSCCDWNGCNAPSRKSSLKKKDTIISLCSYLCLCLRRNGISIEVISLFVNFYVDKQLIEEKLNFAENFTLKFLINIVDNHKNLAINLLKLL